MKQMKKTLRHEIIRLIIMSTGPPEQAGGWGGGGGQRGRQHLQSSLLMCPFFADEPFKCALFERSN